MDVEARNFTMFFAVVGVIGAMVLGIIAGFWTGFVKKHLRLSSLCLHIVYLTLILFFLIFAFD